MNPISFSPRLQRSALRRGLLSSLALLALLLGGCETVANYRTHPDFRSRIANGSNMVASPADIEIRQISAGGVAEEVDEYSEEANRLVAASLNRPAIKTPVETIPISDELQDEYAEVATLAKTVAMQILYYSYWGNLPGFKHKSDNFRYSVGDISRLLEKSGGDQMLFIFGYDSYTTSGRKFVNGMMTVLIGYVALENTGGAYAMLVDRNGDVLWMTQHVDVSIDLRQPEHIDRVVDIFLADIERAKAEPQTDRTR